MLHLALLVRRSNKPRWARQCEELGAGETRNRPSLGCQRAIAHLFATLVRLNELNSFEFMNFFLQVSHSAESD